jgi:hypothetical protein
VHRASVLCVDAEGKPVTGAEVHLFQHVGEGRAGEYVHFGPVMSDASGQAQFSPAVFSGPLGNFDRWVYARVPGKLVGVARSARWTNRRGVINPEARVRRMPSRTVAGNVTVPEGFLLGNELFSRGIDHRIGNLC